MRKTLFGMLIVAFVVIGVADQSWAMGKRRSGGNTGRHHNGSDSGYQSDHFNSQSNNGNSNGGSNEENFAGNNNSNFDGQNDGNSNNENEENPEPEGFVQGSQQDEVGDDRFPAETTVPEPATLALMGMGLAGIFLKRKKI